jgi:hypothetical protein
MDAVIAGHPIIIGPVGNASNIAFKNWDYMIKI